MNTNELTALVRKRFAAPEYAFFTNVANGTGFKANRWADGIAVSIWPSRGLEVHGVELKVSRADWMKELKNPAKAESICKYCDRWWLVVADKSIVQDGELPSTWGLLAPHGTGLKVIKDAPRLSPVPLDKAFVAAICRRACEQSADAEALQAEYKRGVAEVEKRRNSNAEQYKSCLDKLTSRVMEFERAAGISIQYGGNFEEIGKQIRSLKEFAMRSCHVRLKHIRATAEAILQTVDEELNQIG